MSAQCMAADAAGARGVFGGGPVLELSGVSFAYAGARKGERQLAEVSLSVAAGECVVLTGASGCGKTTLTRVVNGLAPHFYGGSVEGAYAIAGRDGFALSVAELGRMVASVFQDPRSQFFATNTTDEVVLGMENVPLPRAEMLRRMHEMGAFLGIDRLLDRRIFPLSSGEKQRIAIASAAVMQPRVLVLDEPSANLDAEGIAHLSTLLARLKERGVAIVLSEHRLHWVRDVADRVALMRAGRIERMWSRSEALALTEGELAEYGMRSFAEPVFTVGASLGDAGAFLDAKALSFASGRTNVLDEACLRAHRGRVLAIMGENGAGKSTLARAVTGVLRGCSGSVALGGAPVSRRGRVRASFFVQQDADYQLYAPRVIDEFMVGVKPTAERERKAREALARVGLAGLEERHPLSLSGGQKQRLLLAVAAASGRDLLVFDEPTSGLDGRNAALVADFLRWLANRGACVLLITHDRDLIARAADEVCYFARGKPAYRRRIEEVAKAQGV